MLAAALKAHEFVMLSNVPGSAPGHHGPGLPDSDRIPARAIEDFMPIAQGRMKRKLMAAAIALQGGVTRVVLASARTWLGR